MPNNKKKPSDKKDKNSPEKEPQNLERFNELKIKETGKSPFAKKKKFFSPETHIQDQIELRLTHLDVTFDETIKKEDSSARKSNINEALNKEKSWKQIDIVERLLIPLLDKEKLNSELMLLGPKVGKISEDLKKKIDDSISSDVKELKQANLRNAQELLISQRLKDFHRKEIRRKTNYYFSCSFILFFIPGVITLIFNSEKPGITYLHHWIYTAITAGCLGSCFSMLSSLKKRLKDGTLEDFISMNSHSYFLSRALIGMASGLIFFYCIQGGIISGSFFPDKLEFSSGLNQDQALNNKTENKEDTVKSGGTESGQNEDQGPDNNRFLSVKNSESLYAIKSLFIIWCFLAGFSEQLVPSVLKKTAKKADADTPKESPENKNKN